jgi:hypothetical protein
METNWTSPSLAYLPFYTLKPPVHAKDIYKFDDISRNSS